MSIDRAVSSRWTIVQAGLRSAVLGALAFWIPRLIVASVLGDKHELHERVVLVVSLLQPAAAAFVLWADQRRYPAAPSAIARAVLIVVVLWLLAPSVITLSWMLEGRGQGFTHSDLIGLILMTVIPFYTIILATYDLTLGGIGLALVGLPVFGAMIDKRRQTVKDVGTRNA